MFTGQAIIDTGAASNGGFAPASRDTLSGDGCRTLSSFDPTDSAVVVVGLNKTSSRLDSVGSTVSRFAMADGGPDQRAAVFSQTVNRACGISGAWLHVG